MAEVRGLEPPTFGFTSRGNVGGYKLIIPDNLVSFKEVFRVVLKSKEPIFPWLELMEYIVGYMDKREGGRILSQEYLSELVGKLYKEYKFYSKYRRV